MEDKRANTHGAGGFDSGSSLYLSLYIILLTFFIALVGVSTLNLDRTRQAVGSVLGAFSASSIFPGSAVEDISQSGQVLAVARQVFADLGALFQSEIPAARVEEPTPGRVLEVTLPASEFFQKNDDTPRALRTRLFDGLIAALAYGEDAGIPRRMTMTVLTGDASDSPYAGDASLEHRRAVALGELAFRRGASPRTVEIGLSPGPLGYIVFTFRIDFENPLERSAPP
ncbi:hypothetical protein IHV25_05475 [Phaeovibrio sulfidiphilus]|uniref:Motility protein B-like N-terminal domain-containing protein n=1 Tax=Phaeovibrio sulfidiphilus TaxID=1220600 RepID=A0A8J7CQR0_9PROT|nr:hypothetical protein [Phaeovibrio sulfidiphilus]MBE1237095.1 hypothetical protein [Phaeovibrio sulfidiphilus]